MSKLIHYSGPAGSYILPLGFVRLSGLITPGKQTQYIDTGVVPDDTTVVNIQCKIDSTTAYGCLFGVENTVEDPVWRLSVPSNESIMYCRYNGSNKKSISINNNIRHDIIMGNGKIYHNSDTVTSYTGSISTTITLGLLGLNRSGKGCDTGAKITLYKCSIWKNGILQKDYIPVKKSDGTIGLLNLVDNSYSVIIGAIALNECPQGFPTSKYCQVETHSAVIQTSDVIPCYRRSDGKPGKYTLSTNTFTEVQGTIGPSITFGWGEVVNNVEAEAHPMLGTQYTETNKFTHTGNTIDSYKVLPVYQRVEPGQQISISFDTDVTQWASCHNPLINKGKWSMWIYFYKVYGPNNSVSSAVCYAASQIKSLGGTRWKYSFTVPADMHMIRVRTNLYSDGSTSYTAHFWNFNWSFGDTGCQVNPLHAIPHNISIGEGRFGEKNSAFHFDGTSYMEVDVGSILPANCTKYTIMMWTKVDTSSVCALFSQRNQVNNTGRYVLYDNTNMYYDDGVRSHFSHGVTRNNWNHYAFVRNGSNKYVYVNGKLINTSSASTAGVFSPVLTIGACQIIDSGVVNQFVGDMKDIKVFDTALTQAQIQQEM